ncbi:hypothetical protein [Kaarinaea lacus]
MTSNKVATAKTPETILSQNFVFSTWESDMILLSSHDDEITSHESVI